MKKILAVFMCSIIFSVGANAGSADSGQDVCSTFQDKCAPNGNAVPEFNAASGTLGLGLVLAIGALIRDRRRRK